MSIAALKKLNALGYGANGTGLELNLVSNPTGAFLPSSQPETEKRFPPGSVRKVGDRLLIIFLLFAKRPF